MTDPIRKALVVRGGWEGHAPVEITDLFLPFLKDQGFSVQTSQTLDVYADTGLLAATDLIVQCWSMGEITAEQSRGLADAVRAGTGFAGWHGGIIDAFRTETRYQLLTGGQFVHHPREFTTYEVRTVADHPIVAGIEPFTVTSEQYYLHMDPAVEVLAVTDYEDDPDNPELAGVVMPVTWTRHWGAGRVFVMAVGHRMADLEVPEVDLIIRRGMAWATR